MIRPIAHSPRGKKHRIHVNRQEEKSVPPVMKRRCPICLRFFDCRDIRLEINCPDCNAAGVTVLGAG